MADVADTRDKIRRWRVRARELRTVADQFGLPSAQDSLRHLAATYEKLADDAEAQLSDGRSPETKETG